MSQVRTFLWRLRRVFGARRHEADLQREIAAHVDEATEDYVRRGLARPEARRAALVDFGGIGRTEEAYRDHLSFRWIGACRRDLRHAGRALRRGPGFAAVAILTLALGIGANTAIFSVIRSAVLEPLPFPRPDRLVMLFESFTADPSFLRIVSAPNFLDWQREVRAFQTSAIWEYLTFNLSGDGASERVSGLRVSSSVFSMVGLAPEAGRTFTAAEDQPGHHVAVISDGLWSRRFGRRPEAIGSTLRLNGEPYQVIGVMPPAFRFTGLGTSVWIPVAFNSQDAERGSHSFFAAARLREGVTMDQARAEFASVGRALVAQYPVDDVGETVALVPMADWNVADARPTLLVLAGAVALLLAIACVNVANLLMAQAAARRREFGVRAALGASRGRLAGQLIVEGLLLSGLGGVAGVCLATISTRALASWLPPSVINEPFRLGASAAHIDGVVLLFTLGVSVLTGLLFSLAPLLRIDHLSDSLTSAGGRTVAGGGLRPALVALEVGLAVVVLAAAGLMIKSLDRLLRVDPGLDPRNVLVLSMTLPQADFYGRPVRKQFCANVTDRVGALPGVLAVGATSALPLSGAGAGRGFTIEGRAIDPADQPGAGYEVTCPGYFSTLGIPVVRGRDFTDRDATDAAPVAIINEFTAQQYWPHDDPIGRRILIGRGGTRWMTIVGIVGNVQHYRLDGTPGGELYVPYAQSAWPQMTITVKTTSDPTTYAGSVRTALNSIDQDVPVAGIATMADVMQQSAGSRRSPMTLLSIFGVVALALAIIGVYGMVSYLAAQRMREMGIRVALGAGAREILRLVIGGAMRPVSIGVGGGILGAVFAGRLLRTLLFEVQPDDPVVIGLIAGALAIAAAAAAVIPARRAARVDPATVLKAE